MSSSSTRVRKNALLLVCVHDCLCACADRSGGKTIVYPVLPCLNYLLFSCLNRFSELKMEAEYSSVTFVPVY